MTAASSSPRVRRKIRVLLVVTGLSQAGAERYVYEICRGLDGTRFHVEILSSTMQSPTDYYAVKLRALGVVIHSRIPEPRGQLLDFVPVRRRTQAIREVLQKLVEIEFRAEASLRLRGFFDDFDVVSVVMVENLYKIAPLLERHPCVFVHLVSHSFQYDYDLYARLPRSGRRHFVLMGDEQRLDLLGTAAETEPVTHLPLPLEMSGRDSIYAGSTGPRRIAIVSRINPQRRLDSLLWAFQALKNKTDARLVLYGRGDATQLRRMLRQLHIADRVDFAEHQTDLRAAIARDQPSLFWMPTVDDTIGYGVIEVATFGVPILFYNFGTALTTDVLERTGGAVRTYGDVSELALETAKVLTQPDALVDIGQRLRAFVTRRHDAAMIIPQLERLYLEALETSSEHRRPAP